jgi:hypothetical protein
VVSLNETKTKVTSRHGRYGGSTGVHSFVLGDRIPVPEENAQRLGSSTIPMAPASVYPLWSSRSDHSQSSHESSPIAC